MEVMQMNYEMEELLPIVGKLAGQYTSNESGSVTYETANQLMGAVIIVSEKQKFKMKRLYSPKLPVLQNRHTKPGMP